jgi:hypothetical protein
MCGPSDEKQILKNGFEKMKNRQKDNTIPSLPGARIGQSPVAEGRRAVVKTDRP